MWSDRLDLLKRKNAGRILLKSWQKELRSVLGSPEDSWHFLDLEESDEICAKCKDSFIPRPLKGLQSVSESSFLEVQLPLDFLKIGLALIPETHGAIYIYFHESDKIGVLATSAKIVNRYWLDLLEFQDDGLIIMDSSFEHKVVVEVLQDAERHEVVDIGAWGRGWTSFIASVANTADPQGS